jgi:hypothetical protein
MTSIQPQPVLIQPNQFILSSYDIGITYETTSLTGTPRFSYTRHGQTLNFAGEEIQTEQTQLGQMVTVNLHGNLKATGATETLTLLIPAIAVAGNAKSAPIQTLAIFSLRSSQVKILGQSQNYMTLYLAGTASLVEF